jgi:peptidoglycan/xylan/chitin deacetylase (PgdA/CDA1 family)
VVVEARTGLDRLLLARGEVAGLNGGAATNGLPLLLRLDDWHLFATLAEERRDGRVLAEFSTADGRRAPLLEEGDGVLRPPFDLDEAYESYVAEAWASGSEQRRISSRQLGLFYRVKRFIPRGVQLALRRGLIRWQGTPTFPGWPLDDGMRRLLQLHAACRLSRTGERELTFTWFWPTPYEAALILSHDVEGEEGIGLALELADLEESLGFRSSFNFGAWYDVDPGVLRELTSRGFEVGMHGLVHDRSLFSSRAEFDRQLPELRALATRLGAVGFRSPATHRVFRWLGELPVEYDGTIPHSDPYEPQPGGCCSLWPFFVGDVVELPYTLPQDHTLLTLLGHRAPDLWIETAREIERRHGLIHCISHPDRGYLGDRAKRDVYAGFLHALAERDRVWHALPAEVATWWRERDAGGASGRAGEGRALRGDSAAEVRLEPPDL